MNELLAHLVGDYVLQSHWMAVNKVKSWFAASIHGTCYTFPFLLITQDVFALAVICGTHIVIDRLSVAKYISQLKNFHFSGNGYPEETPIWLSTWLVIILDNTIHLLINHFALL